MGVCRSVAESEGRTVLREEHLLERLLSTHPRLTDKGQPRPAYQNGPPPPLLHWLPSCIVSAAPPGARELTAVCGCVGAGEVAAQLRLLQAVAPDVLSTSTISSGTLLRYRPAATPRRHAGQRK